MLEEANDAGHEARLAREIEHHRSIADVAEIIWNWDSPSGRRRAARRVRSFVELAALHPGVRALELGCGTGLFLSKVATAGAELHGLDLSCDLLSRARERVAGLANVHLHSGDAARAPFPPEIFDAVYGSSVLHHLDLERAVREVFRLLRPGGRAVFAEPNDLNPQVAFMFRVGLAKRYFGVSPDERAFSRFRARDVFRRAGFSVVDVRPFDFLHPATPEALADGVNRVGRLLERVPGIREIGGSLLISAVK